MQRTILYWLKKVELSGKRVMRNGVSFSNSWKKNKLHCGNTVCEPDESFSLLTGPYSNFGDPHIHPKEPNGSGMLLANSSLTDNVCPLSVFR